MSANQTKLDENLPGKRKFSFYNQIKTPSYLIALAIGNLERKSLGQRVGVITEPEGMESAAKELENL